LRQSHVGSSRPTVRGNDQDDEGSYTGAGFCLGGFQYCDCATAPASFITASQTIDWNYQDNYDGSRTVSFWWNVTDSVVEPHGQDSIKSGQTYRFIFFGPSSTPDQQPRRKITVRAVLFEDGGSWGEQQWIDTLVSVRKMAHKCESEALQALVAAKIKPSDLNSVMHTVLELRRDNTAQAQSVYEKKIIGSVFDEVVLRIQASSQFSTSLLRDNGTLAVSAPFLDAAIDGVSTHSRALEAAERTAKM